jgi:hypothetical protein
VSAGAKWYGNSEILYVTPNLDSKISKEFERKRGMDSYFKKNNWTGSTGSSG